MKSIKTKILLFFIPLIIAISLGLGAITYRKSAEVIRQKSESSLVNIAFQGAKVIESRINDTLNSLEVLALMPEVYDMSIPMEQKMAFLSKEVERKGYIRMGIADTNGIMQATNNTTTTDISDRVHFTKPIKGERAVSDPIVSKQDGSVILESPLKMKTVR